MTDEEVDRVERCLLGIDLRTGCKGRVGRVKGSGTSSTSFERSGWKVPNLKGAVEVRKFALAKSRRVSGIQRGSLFACLLRLLVVFVEAGALRFLVAVTGGVTGGAFWVLEPSAESGDDGTKVASLDC